MINLEKIFSIKKEEKGVIFKFFCLSIKFTCFVNLFQIIKFHLNNVMDNTVLLIEPNNCHCETLLGYYKYLKELGYEVEILIRGNSNNLFAYNDNEIEVWECNKKTFDFIIKYLDFSKYYCLFFNSKRVYWKGNNKFNDGSDIFNCYKKIPRGIKENIYVQHHIDFWNDCKKERQIVLANPMQSIDLKTCVVNPHYYGKIKITDKNEKVIKFITVGAFNIQRRNLKLLIKSVEKLHKKGIFNFEIIVIGSGSLEGIPSELFKYFRIMGKVDFPTMFKAMEEADYFLPLLDPNIDLHNRYLKYGTSGSFQLIYGFLKPCIIHKIFADTYNFSKKDSIIYEDNDNLYLSLKYAIEQSGKDYQCMQHNLECMVKSIEAFSIDNLRNMIGAKSQY